MKLDIEQFALLGVLTASVHYIVARSQITEFAWSRAPKFLDALLRCAACSGFWLGIGAGLLNIEPVTELPPLGAVIAAGAVGAFITPIAEGLLLKGLQQSSMAADEPAYGVPRTSLRRMSESLRDMADATSSTAEAHTLLAQAATLDIASHLGPHACDSPECVAGQEVTPLPRP